MALENAGLTWGNYGGYAFGFIKELAGHTGNHTRDLFAQHAQAGSLPTVSWVYGDGRPDLSEHPRQNVTDGSQWTAAQVKALVDGGLWDRAAIFITWDDWGGWFDHVEPPVKETWDSTSAQRPQDANAKFDGDPFRFGSRVPCLVISPYAKAGYVSSQENSHVSLVRFCETTFGLDPLTDRDAQSIGMADCFDLTQRPLEPPSPAPPAPAPPAPAPPAPAPTPVHVPTQHALLESMKEAAERARDRIAEAQANEADLSRQLTYATMDVERILSLIGQLDASS
jgi:phospholipase C